MAKFVRIAKEIDTHFMLMEMRQGMSEKELLQADIAELEMEIKTSDGLLVKHKGKLIWWLNFCVFAHTTFTFYHGFS
jgi:hypothetical protein